ncbi:hypothetical protein ZWY2020_053387 [Hordeum vulgare]|nr:hypothetical protein ZWY2020_053387 [Hordeum vulgare]
MLGYDYKIYMKHRMVKGYQIEPCGDCHKGGRGRHALLNKLQPETVMLNPNMIGNVRQPKKKEKKTKKEVEEEIEDAVEAAKSTKVKNKTKGRSKPSKRAKKKEEEVLRAKRPLLDQYKEIKGILRRNSG